MAIMIGFARPANSQSEEKPSWPIMRKWKYPVAK